MGTGTLGHTEFIDRQHGWVAPPSFVPHYVSMRTDINYLRLLFFASFLSSITLIQAVFFLRKFFHRRFYHLPTK